MTGSVYAEMPEEVHMYRGTTMAGIVSDEAVLDTSRGFAGGYELETLSLGLPFMPAFLDPGAWGKEYASALDNYRFMAGLWIVGRRHAAGIQPGHIARNGKRPVGFAGSQRALRRPPERCGDARPCIRARQGVIRGSWSQTRALHAALSFDAQSRHLPHERESPRRGRQQAWTGARCEEPVHQRWQPVHHRRSRRTRRSRSCRWPSGRPITLRSK